MGAQEIVGHLIAVLHSIRKVDELFKNGGDRKRFLNCICDEFIHSRGIYNAWIVFIDEAGKFIECGEAGLGDKFLTMFRRLQKNELTERGWLALNRSEIVITEDPFSTCQDCPLSDKYYGRGAMTIRLECGGKVYGLLTASVRRNIIADNEQQSLFKELACNIAFALHCLVMEKKWQWTKQVLKKKEMNLELATINLAKANTALEMLLKKYKDDERKLEEKVLSNVRQLTVPYLEKLKKSRLNKTQQAYVSILESNLNNIISPFLHRLSSKYLDLSPSELQVANLVKQGRRTKEIAELLNLSARTVEYHRYNVRKKLGIKGKTTNLRTSLLSFQ